MIKDPAKQRRCSECKRLVSSADMRPLSRKQLGRGLRYACPECFARVVAFRKATKPAT